MTIIIIRGDLRYYPLVVDHAYIRLHCHHNIAEEGHDSFFLEDHYEDVYVVLVPVVDCLQLLISHDILQLLSVLSIQLTI